MYLHIQKFLLGSSQGSHTADMATQRLPNLCPHLCHLPHVAFLTAQKGGPAGPSDHSGVALSGPAVVSTGPALALEVEKRRAVVTHLLSPTPLPNTDFCRTHLTALILSCLPSLGEQPHLPPAMEKGKGNIAATWVFITSESPKPVRGGR